MCRSEDTLVPGPLPPLNEFAAAGYRILPDLFLPGLSGAYGRRFGGLPIIRVEKRQARADSEAGIFVGEQAGASYTLLPEELRIEYDRGGLSEVAMSHVIGDHAIPLLLACLPGCVLHGALLATGSVSVAVLGISGAGKSTVAAAWVAAGRAFCGDDWFRVVGRGEQAVSVPSHPSLRLSNESAELAGFRPAGARAFRAVRGRDWWQLPGAGGAFCGRERRIAGMVVIERDGCKRGIEAETLGAQGAFLALLSSIRIPLTRNVELWRRQLEGLCLLSERLRFVRVRVPEGAEGLRSLVSLLDEMGRTGLPELEEASGG
jgi:hypothetical protein